MHPIGYTAPGFSNDNETNHVTVTVRKKGEGLQIFIGESKIAEYENAFPASQVFNSMSFTAGGGSGENDKFYTSNVKIVKE